MLMCEIEMYQNNLGLTMCLILSNNLLTMISNPFDDIDMSILETFDNEDDLMSYLVSKYWLDPAKKIEEIITYQFKNNQQNNV